MKSLYVQDDAPRWIVETGVRAWTENTSVQNKRDFERGLTLTLPIVLTPADAGLSLATDFYIFVNHCFHAITYFHNVFLVKIYSKHSFFSGLK